MLGAVLFAALAGVLVTKLLSQQYADEPVVAIVVARTDVQAGHPLSKAKLRMARWPRSSVPRGAHTSMKALLTTQAVPLVPLVSGQAVLKSQISKPHSGLGVAAKLRPGQRAVAIQASNSVMQAKLLYPGARVDVLTTMRKPGSFDRSEVMTKVLLQNVIVLAVGPRIDAASTLGNHKGKKSKKEDSAETRRVVTLAVSADHAELLVLAKREGRLDLVLRSPQDDAQVRTQGATPRQVLDLDEGREQERRRVPARSTPRVEQKRIEPLPSRRRGRSRRRSTRSTRPSRRSAEPAAPAPPPPPRPKGPTIYRGS